MPLPLAFYQAWQEMVGESLMTMNRKTLLAFSLLIMASLFLVSCSLGNKRGDGKNLPPSMGQPYEVLLEGDTLGIVKEMLTEDVDILPQPEPMCDVISVKQGKVRGSYLLMRTRVVVCIGKTFSDKGSDGKKTFSIKQSHDENAAPQNIIRIHAASLQELKDSLRPRARVLQSAIYEAEQKHLAAVIKQNPEKQKLVKRLFGINIKIPAQLDASKEAKDFLWLSNNASRGMQNLIFLRVNARWEKEAIDSMLRKNMIGETDDMYMQLKDAPQQTDGKYMERSYPKRLYANLTQGLWEMKGDAMGGPYRLKRLPLSAKKGTLYIIGFVYAPEMNKRNLMKQLEAVISTATIVAKN